MVSVKLLHTVIDQQFGNAFAVHTTASIQCKAPDFPLLPILPATGFQLDLCQGEQDCSYCQDCSSSQNNSWIELSSANRTKFRKQIQASTQSCTSPQPSYLNMHHRYTYLSMQAFAVLDCNCAERTLKLFFHDDTVKTCEGKGWMQHGNVAGMCAMTFSICQKVRPFRQEIYPPIGPLSAFLLLLEAVLFDPLLAGSLYTTNLQMIERVRKACNKGRFERGNLE